MVDKFIKNLDVQSLSTGEREKIMALLSKDSSQREEDSTRWMYEEPKANPEEFLLGKKITDVNQIRELRKREVNQDETPEARFTRKDMQMKFREDPITLIRQTEMVIQANCLQNTAKMKKVQKLLQMQEKTSKKKHKKSKKGKKEKKRGKGSSSNSDSSSDELLREFLNVVKTQTESSSSRNEASSFTRSAEHRKRDRSRSPHSTRHRERSDEKAQKSSKHIDSRRRSRSRSLHREPHVAESVHRSKSKLSQEELARRRDQMQSDARVREEERAARTKEHLERTEAEERKQRDEMGKHGATFVKNMTLSHVSGSTLEESINRKKSRHQRTEHDKNNFLRR